MQACSKFVIHIQDWNHDTQYTLTSNYPMRVESRNPKRYAESQTYLRSRRGLKS